MSIITFDELPRALEAERAGLDIAAFGGHAERKVLHFVRRSTTYLADYVALYEREGDRLWGQVLVARFPYAFRNRTEIVAGLMGVTTRKEAAGRGVATRLIQAVHSRERRAGIRHVFLWTNPSWHAHDLYEKLGYRDVYCPPLATKWIRRTRPVPAGWTVRPARVQELRALERIHGAATRAGLGFAPRPRRCLDIAVRFERMDLKSLLVTRRHDRVMAYALVNRRRRIVRCGELMALDPSSRAVTLSAVESMAAGSVCGLDDSVVGSDIPDLRDRGYTIAPSRWWVLMARPLGSRSGQKWDASDYGTEDARFTCMTLDRF